MSDNYIRRPVEPTLPRNSPIVKIICTVSIFVGIFGLFVTWIEPDVVMLAIALICMAIGIIGLIKELKSDRLCRKEYEERFAEYKRKLELYNRTLEKILDEEEQKENNLIASIKDGTYAFPARAFYENCKIAGVESLDSEYSLAKAARIMEAMFPEVEKSDCVYYTSRVKEYFDKGLCKYNEYWQKAHEGNLPTKEEQLYIQNNQYVKCIGSKKREKILSDAIELLDSQIAALRKGEEAAFEAGIAAFKSYDTTPSGKWAYMGGAASAIGGPALGMLVGASEMQKDLRQKELNSKAAYSAFNNMYDLSLKAGVDAANLEKERDRLELELEEIDNKIVLQNTEKKALFDSLILDLVKADCILDEYSYTAISVSVTNNYKGFNEKEALNLVLDGYIKADLFWGDILIDSFKIALPCYGVGFGEKVTLEAYSPRYIDYAGRSATFRTVLTDGTLWVMEK